MLKTCKSCKRQLETNKFQFRPHSGTYRKSCRDCESAARRQRNVSDASKRQKAIRKNEKIIKQRQDPRYRPKFILADAKRYDRIHHMETDLTREFITEKLQYGCCYCGDTETKMTLDRIDNEIGHVSTNVVPACYRCNILRGNMPYNAWMNIVPAIRDTREKGLFLLWSAGIKKVSGV